MSKISDRLAKLEKTVEKKAGRYTAAAADLAGAFSLNTE